MIYKVTGIKDEEAAKYECMAYTLIAHRRSCAFCKYCTDIFYDYTNGPYLFFCDKHIDVTQEILRDGCNIFEKDVSKIDSNVILAKIIKAFHDNEYPEYFQDEVCTILREAELL